MRYLATPEFVKKLQSLAAQPSVLGSLQPLIADIESSTRESLLSSKLGTAHLTSEDGVISLRKGPVRLFLSLGKDTQGDYALLLDLAIHQEEKRQPLILRNPNTDSRLNPHFNTAINPNYNTTLNPNYNTTINPNYNTTLNPNYNTTINPNYNTTLNPSYNTTLNPRYNFTYGGPYVFDQALNRVGYLVRANDAVSLMFDENSHFTGIAITNSAEGRTLFDKNNNWTGYLIPDKQGGYLRFNNNGQWIGIVV
jgi:hypothetical protein